MPVPVPSRQAASSYVPSPRPVYLSVGIFAGALIAIFAVIIPKSNDGPSDSELLDQLTSREDAYPVVVDVKIGELGELLGDMAELFPDDRGKLSTGEQREFARLNDRAREVADELIDIKPPSSRRDEDNDLEIAMQDFIRAFEAAEKAGKSGDDDEWDTALELIGEANESFDTYIAARER